MNRTAQTQTRVLSKCMRMTHKCLIDRFPNSAGRARGRRIPGSLLFKKWDKALKAPKPPKASVQSGSDTIKQDHAAGYDCCDVAPDSQKSKQLNVTNRAPAARTVTHDSIGRVHVQKQTSFCTISRALRHDISLNAIA